MIKMNKILTLIALCTFLGLMSACSGHEPTSSVVNESDLSQAGDGLGDAADIARTPEDVITPGNDNTEVITSVDLYGNRTETRVFKGHRNLDRVIIRTLVDGKKVGYAHGRDGSRKQLPDHLIAVAFVATADEITDSAGIGVRATEITRLEPAAPSEQVQYPTEVLPQAPASTVGPSLIEAPVANESQRAEEARRKEAERVERLRRELGHNSLYNPNRNQP
jgi:hypothetical protein